jgi:FlaA1/EpsC-like NDP-sugar epimerase
VRESARLEAIAQTTKPSVVFHAAAYKHVPLMEELNEIEALRTNVLGTLHAARVAGECRAKRFVHDFHRQGGQSHQRDGREQALAELVVQGVAAQHPAREYVSVRFGNVLGSSGSVVPLFTAQIAQGGPVTVTHPDIVRYFMTIPEAAQLVLQAGLMGQSGQIFVLDMGEPVKIVELARMLIRLSGKTEPRTFPLPSPACGPARSCTRNCWPTTRPPSPRRTPSCAWPSRVASRCRRGGRGAAVD